MPTEWLYGWEKATQIVVSGLIMPSKPHHVNVVGNIFGVILALGN